MTELIVLIGLPGAGKSTYAKKYIERRVCQGKLFWKECSSDKMRRILYGDERIQGKPDTVFNALHRYVEEQLKKGDNVVYDATNVTRKNRKQIIALGKKYNCKVQAIVVWAPVDICIARDAARDRVVGPDVIMKMLKRFEVPYFDEGFEDVQVVNTVEGYNEDAYIDELLEAMKIPHDNPHHTFNIYEHCVAARDYSVSTLGNNTIINDAAMFHDIGKPMAKFFKEGKPDHAHYYNHDNIGGYLSLGIFKFTIAMLVPWLISNHMQPFFDSKYYREMPEKLRTYIDMLHECDLNAH